MRAMVVAVLVAVAMGAGQLGAQRFTSRADAVRVDVLVTNGNRPVSGLAASDFELRDNGVVQHVEVVERESLPVNVICVFDTSGSVAGNQLRDLVGAGHALADGLQPSDRMALVTFSSQVRLLAPLTSDAAQVRLAFGRMEATGRTMLRDGVFAGLTLRDDAPGRALVLLFSDGYDTGSWISSPRLIEAAKRTDLVLYAVAVPNAVTERYGPLLDELTEESGGRVVKARSGRDLHGTFARILGEFRDRYVLTYAPANVASQGWHRLDVALKAKRGKVTARRGYFVD